MIGVFDSGLGGLMALSELHRLLPRESTLYLADRENAPYGTKSRTELVKLVSEDARRLTLAGAERILVGCCTACTVLDGLGAELRERCTPIIGPAVREALENSKNGRIAVLCTEAARKSRAYEEEAALLDRGVTVEVVAAQKLVALVEGGLTDESVGEAERRELLRICGALLHSNADTLILGCTHFSYLEGTLGELFGMRTVSAARSGAMHFAKQYLPNN